MASRRKKGSRVLGPYHERAGWRVVFIDAEGGRSDCICASEEEAHQHIANLERKLELEGPVTVEEALEKYEQWQRGRGLKPGTVATNLRGVRSLVGDAAEERRLVALCTGAPEAYAALVARPAGKHARAADTHQNALKAAKAFGRWCVKQGWIRRNPWEAVEPVGVRRKGKEQLTIDEARLFCDKAHALADAGDDSAIAALCAFYLGVRASDVVTRVGRDVDDNGRVLRVTGAKTKAGDRPRRIPDSLVPHMIRLKDEAGPTGYLFRAESKRSKKAHRDRNWLLDNVYRICALAGVPEVCTHGLRGSFASAGAELGEMPQTIAANMGHASPAVTLAHYAQPGAVASGRSERAMKVLQGGRR